MVYDIGNMANVENLKNIQPKHGGARQGAGRPEHGKNKTTIIREEAERQFKDRVAKNVDRLFNSQLNLALGEKYLMVITTIGTGNKQRRETSIVTDPEIIKTFLDDENSLNDDTEYYYMTTKPANNQALEGLLNRAFGRAKESIDMTTNGKDLPTPILSGLSQQNTNVDIIE